MVRRVLLQFEALMYCVSQSLARTKSVAIKPIAPRPAMPPNDTHVFIPDPFASMQMSEILARVPKQQKDSFAEKP